MAAKVVSNAAAGRAFRWSLPGSVQLGFLLAQGSEFTFVVLSLPAVRALIGEARVSIVVAAVALSLAVTPNLATVGRVLAGRLRRHDATVGNPELEMRDRAAPVLIVGMGRIGRTLANGLTAFGIAYAAIERDERRLREAIADGYVATFGDISDLRLWEPLAIASRKIGVLTKASYDSARERAAIVHELYPGLVRYSAAADQDEAARLGALGLRAVVDRSFPPGVDLAAAVLAELGVEADAIAGWMRREQERALGRAGGTPLAA
jgi:CPA2 family monovalent cation:H+ antiporter-2